MPLISPTARRETLVRAEERDSLLVSSTQFREAKSPTMNVKVTRMGELCSTDLAR